MAKPLMSKLSKLPLSVFALLALGALAVAGCSDSGEDARPPSEASATTATSVGGSAASTRGSAQGGANQPSDSRGMTQGGASASQTSSGSSVAVGGSVGVGGGGSLATPNSSQGGNSASTGDSPSSGRGGSNFKSTTSAQSNPATGGARASSTKATGGTASAPTATGGKAAGGAGGKAVGGSTASNPKATGGAQAGGAPSTGGATTASSFPVGTGKPTVYIAGDSTAQTYSANTSGQQGWGQRISEFFTTEVTFVNKSIGGRSSKSFIDEGRLDEILAVIKQGDYLFAQWGINDRYQSDTARYTNPATTFRTYLKQYIDGARKKNAIPVLLTPTPRHQYVNGVFENGFAAYCDAIKAVGKETNTPVIDVQTKALAYYTSIGDDVVSSKIMLDVLHFKAEGAYQMARLVAEGVHESILPISNFVIESKLAP